jgi:hypothetical protein
MELDGTRSLDDLVRVRAVKELVDELRELRLAPAVLAAAAPDAIEPGRP